MRSCQVRPVIPEAPQGRLALAVPPPALQHGPGRMEARAVAGTIPGTIGRVPADKAFQMRADRGTHRHVTFVVAIHRTFLPMQAHDFPFPFVHVVEGVIVWRARN